MQKRSYFTWRSHISLAEGEFGKKGCVKSFSLSDRLSLFFALNVIKDQLDIVSPHVSHNIANIATVSHPITPFVMDILKQMQQTYDTNFFAMVTLPKASFSKWASKQNLLSHALTLNV